MAKKRDRSKRKLVIPMRVLKIIQNQLTGDSSQSMSIVQLANHAAKLKGWALLDERQPKYRTIAKNYLMVYLKDLLITNKNLKEPLLNKFLKGECS